MARQVYFDPFGSYTGGYQRGVQQESGLQQDIRTARDSDYKYNVINPLELNKLQREDAVGVAAQPYRLKLPELGYLNARNETAKGMFDTGYLGAQFGQNEPTAQALSFLTGRGYTMDPQGYLQLTDTMGNPYGPQLDQRGVLQGYAPFRQEQYGREDKAYSQAADNEQLYWQGYNAQTARAGAEANAQAALQNAQAREDQVDYRYGPGSGGQAGRLPSFLDFGNRGGNTIGTYMFGGPPGGVPQAPQATPPQQYVASPRPAQPIPGQTNTSADMVAWMQASNPYAPAITADEWDAMGPAGQQNFMRKYFPQVSNAGYASPVPSNPANYNPYSAAP